MNAHGAARLRAIVLERIAATRGALAIAALCLVGAIAAELAAPWPVKILFDHVLLGQPLTPALAWLGPLFAEGMAVTTAALAVAVFGLVLAGGACAFVQIFITARLGHELAHRLRIELFRALQRLPLAQHRRTGSGEAMVRFAADTTALKDVVSDWVLTIVAQTGLVIGMLVVMFLLDWRLALVVTLTLPVLFGVLAVLNRRIRRSLAAQRRQEGRLASRVGEVLASLAVVQAFGRVEHEAARFDAASAEHLDDGVRTSRTTAAVARSIALVSAAASAVTLLVGARQVLEGHMTPGDLLVFMAYLRSLFKPLRDLGKLSVKVSRATVSAARIADVIGQPPGDADRPGAVPVTRLRGEVTFDDVRFGYDPRRRVLDGASFHVAAGEHVAIVGASGSGKSTIASLVLRLLVPDDGVVRIDGRDVRDWEVDSLRGAIGVVLQDTLLFGATVRENIAYGKIDATDAEIEAAARDAQVHDVVMRLPDGYDTVVGDRGGLLSGGERQRVCLARALVKRPDILVLDEPTAAIDPLSSRLVRESVARVRRGRTTIVISHALADMRDFDRILVIADGAVAEAGSRAELMARRGRYFALARPALVR
jgi:ABC-type multidrug transport system fused ATPase/permease subunit